MADVYLATDIRHARRVAIKVMRRETVGPQGRERFLREISIAANLSHPNIVPLFDSGQIGTSLYYVMPYVEGKSLRDRLTLDGSVPVGEALTIVTEVADALTCAHERGVVHRDIKPGNILLEAGHARVTDFGIAKAIEAAGRDHLTSGQFAVGTLAYMSPEQASAPSTVDARSDIYALAIVLYEMLSGELPFPSSIAEGVLARKSLGDVHPLRPRIAGVSGDVDRAIARALMPKPADRFGSVADFVAALRGGEIADSAATRRTSNVRRRRWIVGVGAVAVAVSLAVAAAALRRDRNSPARAPAAALGRIVVASLRNTTGDPSLDLVGSMAGDWLTEGLQRTGLLEVVPPASAPGLNPVGADGIAPARWAEETGAGTVVSGAYYRRANQILFRLQIADQAGKRVVGSITEVSTPVADPIRGVEELRNRLMGWLALHYDERLQLPAAATDRPPTYEAYRAFNDGMTEYIATQNAHALPLFLKAYQLDSSFTQALLYATFALTNLGDWPRADSVLRVVDRKRNSLSEYDRAWLDHRLGIVHGNGEQALEAMRKAAKLAPASKAAYNHAVAAFQNGYVHEALTAIESLAPDRGAMRGFASYWSIYGSIVHALGDFKRERSVGTAARAAYPERLIAFPPLLRSYAATGQLPELAAALRTARGLPPDPYLWDYGLLLTETAEELRAHGHPGEAATYFAELRDWLAVRDTAPRVKWRLVQALYAMGRLPEARTQLATLRRAQPDNVDYVGMTGLIDARTGQRVAALQIADSLAARHRPYEFGTPNQYRARIAAVLGDKETAVAALRQCRAEGRPYHLWIHRDIDLESLHGYPPFEAILQSRD